MPIISPQRTKQKKLIYAAVLIILATAAVLYFQVLGGGIPDFGAPALETQQFLRMMPTKIELEEQVLESDSFLNLEAYQRLSSDIATGRSNPFLPGR